MNLQIEIIKNNIPIKSLEDETLVELFRELIPKLSREKTMAREILKTLVSRKKLFLLTKGR